jgi:hypothetical protein
MCSTALAQGCVTVVTDAPLLFQCKCNMPSKSGGSSGSLCACSYEDEVVSQVRHVLLVHTVIVRNSTGQRVVTFDQWAQLYDYISRRLGIVTLAKLQQRLGVQMSALHTVDPRFPLEVCCCWGTRRVGCTVCTCIAIAIWHWRTLFSHSLQIRWGFITSSTNVCCR